MTNKQRIERLEQIVLALCEAEINGSLDYSWQAWADPLHEFIKEMKEEDTENDKEERSCNEDYE